MKPSIVALIGLSLISVSAQARGGLGHYVGGVSSSHKGGHYFNPATGNHYQRRPHP